MSKAKSAEKVVQDIRRKTRRRFSAEEKIRIILEGPNRIVAARDPARVEILIAQNRSTRRRPLNGSVRESPVAVYQRAPNPPCSSANRPAERRFAMPKLPS